MVSKHNHIKGKKASYVQTSSLNRDSPFQAMPLFSMISPRHNKNHTSDAIALKKKQLLSPPTFTSRNIYDKTVVSPHNHPEKLASHSLNMKNNHDYSKRTRFPEVSS